MFEKSEAMKTEVLKTEVLENRGFENRGFEKGEIYSINVNYYITSALEC